MYHYYLHDVNIPVEEWIAKCGWKYGLSAVIKIMVMPEGISYKRLCKRCFKVLRAKMRFDQIGDAPSENEGPREISDSSSSSSSSDSS